MSWNAKYWDILSNLYWTPRYLGLKSISREQWSVDGDQISIPKSLVKNSTGPLYFRERKFDELTQYLERQEEILNHLFNLTFGIAADAVISKLLFEPLGLQDHGPIQSLGREIGERYGWGHYGNVTQQDGLFVTPQTVVGVELKLGSKSWAEQVAKYIALFVLELERSGPRDQIGLLFIVPEQALASHWSTVGLTGNTVDAGFLDRLNADNLPAKIQELLREKPDAFRAVVKKLRLAVLTWRQFRDSLEEFGRGLDVGGVGDQTLVRLLAGLREQIDRHGGTGFMRELNMEGDGAPPQ